MKRSYQLKRLLGNRFGMSAALFLLVLFIGAFTVLFGVLDNRQSCKGYTAPNAAGAITKRDPTAPGRGVAAAATALKGPAKTEPVWEQLAAASAKTEREVTEALDNSHLLIQLYGAVQDLSGRTVVEDPAGESYTVSKLKNGALTFTGEGTPDAGAEAAELKRLQLLLADRDIPLLYVQAPSKIDPAGGTLPYGVTDTGNECADRLMAALEEAGVDHMDLRDTFAAEDRAWEDWFYATDHHWNQDAAFLAFQAICGRLEDYYATQTVSWGTRRQKIAIDGRYTDPESYDRQVLEDYFLGSQGKRVGSLYGGVDDFVLWTPKFPTLMRYTVPSYSINAYGSLEETVLFPQRVEEKDWFEGNPYTYYAGGDYAYARVWNYYNPDGPRVLLIRESFSCAVTPYLACACSQLTTIDPRYFTGNLMTYVDMVKPDVVVVLYSAGTTRSLENFQLLTQPAQPGKGDALMWLPAEAEKP